MLTCFPIFSLCSAFSFADVDTYETIRANCYLAYLVNWGHWSREISPAILVQVQHDVAQNYRA